MWGKAVLLLLIVEETKEKALLYSIIDQITIQNDIKMCYTTKVRNVRRIYMKKNDFLASAKMTSKGQITVPKAIRTKLSLDEGDSVIFYEDENKNIKILNKDNCKVVPNNESKQAIVSKGGKNG